MNRISRVVCQLGLGLLLLCFVSADHAALGQILRNNDRERLLSKPNWSDFSETTQGFKVLLPMQPEVTEEKMPQGKGAPALSQHTYRAFETGGSEIYLVVAVALPEAPKTPSVRTVISRDTYEKLMFRLKENFTAGLRKGNDACRLEDPRDALSGAHQGREYTIKGEGCITAKVRLFATSRHLYFVGVLGGAGQPGFLDSFTILRSEERLVVQ